jgi:hypothetical protein
MFYSPLLLALACSISGSQIESFATVTLGAPYILEPPLDFVVDSVHLIQVKEVLDNRISELQLCYRERLLENPKLSGEVVIHALISTDGLSIEQCITKDTVEDEGIRSCVNRFISEGQYPPSDSQSGNITFPFVFTSVL